MPRKVEYVGGRRIDVSPVAVIAAWRAATSLIPAEYACGTAQHESDFCENEIDTEESGFVSKGIFQIADSEVIEARAWLDGQGRDASQLDGADLCTLEGATKVLAALAEKRLRAICEAAKIDFASPLPDVLFYLGIAHNEGLGAAIKSIGKHGLDAAAWTRRNADNPSLAQAARYFSDCMTGGSRWPEPRT